MLRRIAAGAGRRGQWHLILADAKSMEGSTLPRRYPEMAKIALRNIGPSTR